MKEQYRQNVVIYTYLPSPPYCMQSPFMSAEDQLASKQKELSKTKDPSKAQGQKEVVQKLEKVVERENAKKAA